MDWTEANRAWWDERARIHGQDGFYYDTVGFLNGESAISGRELTEIEAAIGSVRGADILHLQCHIGLSTLTLARAGAHVVGLDLSRIALERARATAIAAHLDAPFIEADAQRLPDELRERFDCVF